MLRRRLAQPLEFFYSYLLRFDEAFQEVYIVKHRLTVFRRYGVAEEGRVHGPRRDRVYPHSNLGALHDTTVKNSFIQYNFLER